MSSSPLAVFNIVAMDSRGATVIRHIQAESIAVALTELAPQGLTCVSWTAQTVNTRSRQSEQVRRSFTASDFAQDLSTLLDSGVPVRTALGVLHRKERRDAAKHVLQQLSSWIGDGLSVSQAMVKCDVFPELLIATVAASERTGDLASGLSRFAQHQRSFKVLRDRVVGACVYPALLLGVGSAIILLLLGVVVPRFSRLLANTEDMPILSRGLLEWGRLADGNPLLPLAMLAVFVSLAISVVRIARSQAARKVWLARIPVVREVVREFQHLQMYRTAAILTSRGETIGHALELVVDLLGPVDQARLRAALVAMREGTAISKALTDCGLSDGVAGSMLAVAEQSGTLSTMLDRVADVYESTLRRNIDIASRLIEPALMVVIGVVIGAIVLMMYLPIFDLASRVG